MNDILGHTWSLGSNLHLLFFLTSTHNVYEKLSRKGKFNNGVFVNQLD